MAFTFVPQFLSEVELELKRNILPFWMQQTVDSQYGGFYNHITNELQIDQRADKGCILNSRILWTYATAARIFQEPSYFAMAKHAYTFMMNHFWDKEFPGLYWMVDYQGNVINSRKQIYNIASGSTLYPNISSLPEKRKVWNGLWNFTKLLKPMVLTRKIVVTSRHFPENGRQLRTYV